MVMRVEAEFRVEATVAMVAARNPATTSPTMPDGSRLKIRLG